MLTGQNSIEYNINLLHWRWKSYITICSLFIFFAIQTSLGRLQAISEDIFTFKTLDDTDNLLMLVESVVLLLAIYVAVNIWSNASIMTHSALKKIRLAFLVILGCGAPQILIVGAFLIYIYLSKLDVKSAAFRDAFMTMGVFAFSGVIASLAAFFGLRRIQSLRQAPVADTHVLFQEIVQMTDGFVKTQSTKWLDLRIAGPAGLLWIIFGTFLLIESAIYLSTEWSLFDQASSGVNHGNIIKKQQDIEKVAALTQALGTLCLLRARRYFLPRAENILDLDRRSPILYLRSFSDDRMYARGRLLHAIAHNFLIGSEEVLLAGHFAQLGPFVAIGAPGEYLAKPGAIRLHSFDDWQQEVISRMEAAQCIIAAIGTSQGISWELSQLVNRKLESKTIFLLPSSSWWTVLTWRDEKRKKQLVEILARHFPPECRQQLLEFPRPGRIRALVINGGKPIFVTSRWSTSGTIYLASIVSHYLFLASHSVARNEELGLGQLQGKAAIS